MKKNILIVLMLFVAGFLAAQSNDDAIKQTKQEIEATFGFYPTIFKIIPDYQVPGMWAYFGAANTTKPPKPTAPPKRK